MIAGMGTEVVESEHVCIPLDSSGGAGFPSSFHLRRWGLSEYSVVVGTC